MIHVAIVAQNVTIRAGLARVLEESGAAEILQTFDRLEGLGPMAARIDVLVVALPVTALVGSDRVIRAWDSTPAVLFLSSADESPISTSGIFSLAVSRWPIRGWGALTLDATASELSAALFAVHEGLVAIERAAMEQVLAAAITSGRPTATVPEFTGELTDRELEVLQRLAKGLANKEIAYELNISEHTVKFHTSSIYGKLAAANRTEAVRLAIEHGILVL